jgi:hypothetical protein
MINVIQGAMSEATEPLNQTNSSLPQQNGDTSAMRMNVKTVETGSNNGPNVQQINLYHNVNYNITLE